MKDVASFIVTQIRIFAPDIIPFRILLTGVGSEMVRLAFKFRSTALNEMGEVIFEGGTVGATDGYPPVIINQVVFNERRISLQVASDSRGANMVFELIVAVMGQLRRDPDFEMVPQLFTEECGCAVSLDSGWEEVFSPKFVKFTKSSLLTSVQVGGVEPTIRSTSVKVQMGFRSTADQDARGIALSDKVLTLEPRIDTPLSEKRYFVASPLGSEDHLRLIGKLESALSSSKKA